MQSPRDNFIDTAEKNGFEYDPLTRRCQCPHHNGEGFNLAVNESDTGDVLLTCHSHGCNASEICQSLGISESSLFADEDYKAVAKERSKEQRKLRTYSSVDEVHQVVVTVSGMKEVGSWDYHNDKGVLVGRVIRLDSGKGKQFRQVSLTDDGWAAVGMAGKRPLYNLQAVMDADQVVVCEGEKACDVVNRMGLVATTSSQGSKSAERTDWGPLRGKDVIFLPDNDTAGQMFVKQVQTILPASTSWVQRDLSAFVLDLIPGGDAADVTDGQDDAAEAVKSFILEGPVSGSYTAPPAPPGGRFAGRTVAELWAAADEKVDWYIEDCFTCAQPTVFGAKQKSMKTTFLSDMAVALASGTDWLGKFKIPEPRKVLFITGESSDRGSMKRIRQAMEVRGLGQYDVRDYLRIETDLFPNLNDTDHCLDIRAAVDRHDIETVIVDPLYMGLVGVSTSNLFEVGPVLRRTLECCKPANLILSHHVKKGSNYNQAPSLEDLSQAGIAEFAGNFWMMGRLDEYKGDGTHNLAVRLGGRDDQFGLWHLYFDENTWECRIQDLEEWNLTQKENEAVAKEAEEQDAFERKRAQVFEMLDANGPSTCNSMDSSGRLKKTLEKMVANGDLIVYDGYEKDGRTRRGKHYAKKEH
jgi:RecA-family ATPase/5S rRNA maturation endonuclease (ribonuclease M5)